MREDTAARRVTWEEQAQAGHVGKRYSYVSAPPMPPTTIEPAALIKVLAPGTDDVWAGSGAWESTESRQSRDSVSAQDRARGANLRSIPVLISTTTLAAAGTVAYVLTGVGKPLDVLFVFLLLCGAFNLIAIVLLHRMDFQHSHAGLERMRIETAGRVAERAIEAQTAQRIEALKMAIEIHNTQRGLITDGTHRD